MTVHMHTSVKIRNSSIELLRIVSMFLVLSVHADFLSLGIPKIEDVVDTPIAFWTRSMVESISIVCVNVFVMISGWFGIKASVKGLSSFLFQCLFFSVGLYILSVIVDQQFNFQNFFSSFLMSSYWFVPAYLALYIISPVLNSFLEKHTIKQISKMLVFFFSFQTIFGCTGLAKFIDWGYSCFSFIGLYLLAALVHKIIDARASIYRKFFTPIVLLCLYFLSSVLLSLLFYLELKLGINLRVYSYINPIVILNSMILLLSFASIRINPNRVINYVASSVFAVYLVHLNKYFGLEYFVNMVRTIYERNNGLIAFGCIVLFLLIIMVISILIDQPRKLLWIVISKTLSKRSWFKLSLYQ